MATAERVLDIALAERDYTECQGHRHTGRNHTKYGRWYGMDGVPWCAIWLSWVFAQAGMPDYRGHWTPGWADAFRHYGMWTPEHPTVEPRRGWLAFFDFPGDSKDRIQHVGIVGYAEPGEVVCVEGNTSAGVAGSQDNGGGVYVRTRPRSHVVGYGRPFYDPEPRPMRLEDEAMARMFIVDDPHLHGDDKGRHAHWKVTNEGAVFAVNGARDCKALSEHGTTRDDISGAFYDPKLDQLILVASDVYQEPDGSWNGTTFGLPVAGDPPAEAT